MARRPTPNNKYPTPAVDEPLAWESREFLRKLLVGKTVLCTVSYKTDTGREYGKVLMGSNNPDEADDVAEKLVMEGLAKVRDNCKGMSILLDTFNTFLAEAKSNTNKNTNNNVLLLLSDDKLKAAEETAKTAEKGMHAPDASERVRQVVWEIDNPRQLVDRMLGKPISAIIENVRDGSTVRAFLLPDFYHITLMMSGVKVLPIIFIFDSTSYYRIGISYYNLCNRINPKHLFRHQRSVLVKMADLILILQIHLDLRHTTLQNQDCFNVKCKLF